VLRPDRAASLLANATSSGCKLLAVMTTNWGQEPLTQLVRQRLADGGHSASIAPARLQAAAASAASPLTRALRHHQVRWPVWPSLTDQS